MHSSRMRTGRSLTVCWSLLRGVSASQGVCVCQWGVCLLLGRCLLPGGCLLWGLCVSAGGGIPARTEADTPPVHRITDTSKNMTLATTSLRPVINDEEPYIQTFYYYVFLLFNFMIKINDKFYNLQQNSFVDP